MFRSYLVKFFFAFSLSFFADIALADDAPPAKPPAGGTAETKLAAALKRQEELEAENAELKKTKDKKPEGDNDLIEKVRKEKEDKERESNKVKDVERSIRFNLTIDDFVKNNKDFLPEEVAGILSQAGRERYDNEFEKASALKSAILSSYFSQQANIDSLTPSQKRSVENWKGLTKSDRENKAADLYENVFEPCIDAFRRVKKAEEVALSRKGIAKPTAHADNYKEKLIKGAQRAHLGIKD